MIIGSSLTRLISKLNANGGTGGSGDDPGEAERGGTAPTTTGTVSGMATGFGQTGYGTPSEGQPGIFGGDFAATPVLGIPGDVPDFASNFSNLQGLSTGLSSADAASLGLTDPSSSIDAALNAAFADVDARGDATTFGTILGKDVALGNMTADEANAVIANADLGFTGTTLANLSAAQASLPPGLATGLPIVGMPVTASLGLAAALAAATGQGMLGEGSGLGEGEGSGPMGPIDPTKDKSEAVKVLEDTPVEGDTMADTIDSDFLEQLKKDLGFSDRPNITAKIGNQQISFMPKAQRDELSILLDYVLKKEGLAQGESQYTRTLAQDEPSFVDKSSQLLGLGSDALGLWTGLSGLFG